MKTKLNLERIIEEHSNEQYCAFCIKPRNPSLKCCDDPFFILFSDLDTYTQYERAHEIETKGG
jgi:hypothetical protein